MLHKADCLRLPSLKLLIFLSEQKESLTTQEIKAIAPPDTSTASATMGSLTTLGLAEKLTDTNPPSFRITKKGRQHLKEDLELFPLEGREYTVFKGKKAVVNPRGKKAIPVATAPLPPPNLSVSAESLMGNISVVLEENARLRNLLESFYHQLGEALNVKPSEAE